jgi:hypothetical protein
MNRTSSLQARPRAQLAPFSAILAALCAALTGSSTAGAATPQTAAEGGTWARAKANAVVRNFADGSGSELARLAAGHPLRVFATSDGTPRFHEVEVGGGVPVWVFGELLQPTNIDGVLRVDAQGVNMRPMPESSPRSMALRTKLASGARLVLIERHDPSKPLAEDWVKVWSPDTARVWVEVSEVEAVPAGDAAATSAVQTAWVEAARQAPTPREVERQRAKERAATASASERLPALPAIASVPAEAMQLATRADLAFDAALARPDADSATWAEVVDLYAQTAALAPAGTATAARAQERQRSSEARREIAALRETMQAEDDRRKRELAEIMAERERSELGRTTHMGRFQGRGFLYSRVIGGERRWYLDWKGETVAEVRCSSERYDLSTFQGFELGLTATTISPPTSATALSEALPKVLDIMRIEVLSGGHKRR